MTPIEPKSQREQLLLDIVQILARTVLDLGADSAMLRSQLSSVRQSAFTAGSTETVKILDNLMGDLFPPPQSPLKPPFRIV